MRDRHARCDQRALTGFGENAFGFFTDVCCFCWRVCFQTLSSTGKAQSGLSAARAQAVVKTADGRFHHSLLNGVAASDGSRTPSSVTRPVQLLRRRPSVSGFRRAGLGPVRGRRHRSRGWCSFFVDVLPSLGSVVPGLVRSADGHTRYPSRGVRREVPVGRCPSGGARREAPVAKCPAVAIQPPRSSGSPPSSVARHGR
jgi:hypothetical protein